MFYAVSHQKLKLKVRTEFPNVTLNHNASLYACTGLILTCTVPLDPNATMVIASLLNGVVSRTYQRNNTQSLVPVSLTVHIYTDSLTISPLSDQDGVTCTYTIYSDCHWRKKCLAGYC